jgi:selenide,water dikinase
VRALLYDPQTAGGLLVSVAAGGSGALLQSLRAAGVAAMKIGSVLGAYTAGSGEPAILLR